MANYCFYTDLNINPIKLYVSGSLDGHIQLAPNFVIGNLVLSPSKPKSASDPSSKSRDGSTGKDESTQVRVNLASRALQLIAAECYLIQT
ncbi:Predicted protein [Wolbachia endosymbiont strain TRS of Brugia malayi]|uniref:hypothetical protein n=1 Tax=Wolbachia endosymbiont of Brugia malayi TaxID=80849 RepID=UPI00004C9468|nr:hypothetical protein [Wolbachia endosymbiont of Brugia malayi]AAW71192.1 Predicted protein [Wolbachia endosymbiont strain TRS of Brugia malayi]